MFTIMIADITAVSITGDEQIVQFLHWLMLGFGLNLGLDVGLWVEINLGSEGSGRDNHCCDPMYQELM